jgi:uncharacterized membrane protein
MDLTIHVTPFWCGVLVASSVWIVLIVLYAAYDSWAKRTFR